jgi:hypothetical protein
LLRQVAPAERFKQGEDKLLLGLGFLKAFTAQEGGQPFGCIRRETRDYFIRNGVPFGKAADAVLEKRTAEQTAAEHRIPWIRLGTF